jgi:hypothetical protein
MKGGKRALGYEANKLSVNESVNLVSFAESKRPHRGGLHRREEGKS